MLRKLTFHLAFMFALAVSAIPLAMSSRVTSQPANQDPPPAAAYLGFDRNVYPGDDAVPILRKTFAYSSYWISPPPGEKINTWTGKRQLLQSQGFGFMVLFRGRESRELKTAAKAKEKSALDARDALASAQSEGFAKGTVIFLDIEEGGRLPATYHAYLRNWIDQVAKAGYRAGVYCSGVPASEGKGVTILTSDDIRRNIGPRELIYWIFNDFCPPAPGCGTPKNPPPVSAGGVPYAAVWQFAQSPRRKERTARCAATYHTDGNCYAPGDVSHAWFLDVNSATSPDPSAPGK
jgi:Domain of unknown function (DUF1906)